MTGSPRKPLQFGLGSLFTAMTIVAIAAWLGPDKSRLAMFGLAAICGLMAAFRIVKGIARKRDTLV